MKRLLFSISLALSIHAMLLFGDFSRLQLFSVANPELETIEIALVAYSPPLQQESLRPPVKDQMLDEAPDPIEKIEKPSLEPQPEVPPPEEFRQPQSATPPMESAPGDATAEPDEAGEAVPENELSEPPTARQLLESPSNQAEAIADESAETPPLWRKPKRNLKALTKVTPQTVARIEHIPRPETKKSKRSEENDTLSSSPASMARQKLQSEAAKAESPAPTETRNAPSQPQKKPSLTSALRDTADTVASFNQQAPAAQMVLAKPLYRRNPPPKYPNRARRRGLQGTVILEVLVDEAGQVEDLTIFTSSGHKILDRAARASVKKWLFQPGTKGGKSAKMWVRVPIRFKLKE